MNTAIFPSPPLLDSRLSLFGAARARRSTESSAEAGQAVFLHTGWRSGGTWIWSRCRAFPNVHGFYEPLHEHVARFRRRDLAHLRPGSWQSNHSETAPYFEEFGPLIPPAGRGVPLYRTRFAFDGFFRSPNDPGDPELEAYIASLLAAPKAEGRLPVLKFCRSMGRVGWFEQRFPQALHAVVLRDPIAQFQSAERLLREQRNRYFVVAPLLVLARNADDPAVRAAALALGVNLPTLYSDHMDYAVETCWSHMRRATLAERYRAFLAFWTLCAVAALDSDALVIDMDAIGDNAKHRHDVETALQPLIGTALQLMPRAASTDRQSLPQGWREAHDAAATLVECRRDRLSPERIDIILEKLGVVEALPPQAVSWTTPGLPARVSTSLPRRALTLGAVAMACAVQPLRRLHGSLAKRELFEK